MRGQIICRTVRVACVLALVGSLVCPLPVPQAASGAFVYLERAARNTPAWLLLPHDETAPGGAARRGLAPRLKIALRTSRRIVHDEPIVSATVIDPQKARADVEGAGAVLLTGLAVGETILIISGKNSRATYAVDVTRPPAAPRRAPSAAEDDGRRGTFGGSYGVFYSPAAQGGPPLLRHSFEFSQELRPGQVLRASADVFNFIGGYGPTLSHRLRPGFGANRLTLSVESERGRLDVLDSELDISRLSFDGYTMRGIHLISPRQSALRGAELFAGSARPSAAIFDEGEGRLAGFVAPVFGGPTFRLRAGAFLVAPRVIGVEPAATGFIWHADARYSPDEMTRAEAEAAYARGGLSWRALIEVRRGALNVRGEALRLDPRSPLVSLGAQPSGRQTYSLDLRWRPGGAVGASGGFNHTTSSPSAGLRRTPLDRSSYYAAAQLRLARASRLSFRFTEQRIEARLRGSAPAAWRLQTRGVVLRHALRLGQHWSNEAEGRFNFSREAGAGTELSRGLNVREELRFNWSRNSVTWFVNHQRHAPSLAGLLARDPSLLPEAARAAFEADPSGFLFSNRDLLPALLPGVELPATRSTELGVRVQAALARLSVVGDLRYSAGEVFAAERKELLANFAAGFRLDAANSVQLSGARSFPLAGAGGAQTTLTVSFLHRFGAKGRGGYQLSELLGLNRGRVRGRVFVDQDGNGRDDPGEPGAAGMVVRLDGGREAKTDAGGRFDFGEVTPGEHSAALVSDELGVRLRASTLVEQRVHVAARQTAHVLIGVNDFGFVSGRVFNDLSPSGVGSANVGPGVGGVRLWLRALSAGAGAAPLVRVSDGGGTYDFRNLPPGQYALEIDEMSLPEDFRLTARAPLTLVVEPLRGTYVDLPLAAQRAVSGIVFLDRDGDGLFDPRADEPLGGARVLSGRTEVVTDTQGSYIVRNLPAGRSELRALWAGERRTGVIVVELGAAPTLLKRQDIAVR